MISSWFSKRPKEQLVRRALTMLQWKENTLPTSQRLIDYSSDTQKCSGKQVTFADEKRKRSRSCPRGILLENFSMKRCGSSLKVWKLEHTLVEPIKLIYLLIPRVYRNYRSNPIPGYWTRNTMRWPIRYLNRCRRNKCFIARLWRSSYNNRPLEKQQSSGGR